jgi:hypothetical protein
MQNLPAFPRRPMAPPFPATQGAGINPNLSRRLMLGQSQGGPLFAEPSGQRTCVPIGSISKKLDDLGRESDLGNGSLPFPVIDGVFVHSYLYGNLLLKEVQIQPPFPDVVT